MDTLLPFEARANATNARIRTGTAFCADIFFNAIMDSRQNYGATYNDVMELYIIFTDEEYLFYGRVLSSGSIRGIAIRWSDSSIFKVYKITNSAGSLMEI